VCCAGHALVAPPLRRSRCPGGPDQGGRPPRAVAGGDLPLSASSAPIRSATSAAIPAMSVPAAALIWISVNAHLVGRPAVSSGPLGHSYQR
jgi:hypothetical protein